jgi:hypothetical protein
MIMSEDRELQAMGTVLAAMQPLDDDEKRRVLNWLSQKLALGAPATAVRTQDIKSDGGPAELGNLSTDTIGTIIGANSGRDLIIAAAAHLHFVQGKVTFTRQEIAEQMRGASSHFRSSFINNLSAYLAGLTRSDRLRLTGNDTYALSNRERQELQVRLAEAH